MSILGWMKKSKRKSEDNNKTKQVNQTGQVVQIEQSKHTKVRLREKPLITRSEINDPKQLFGYKDNPLYNPLLSSKIKDISLNSLIKSGYIHEGDDVLRYLHEMDELLESKSDKAYNRKDWDIIQKIMKGSGKRRYTLQNIFDINHDSMLKVLRFFNVGQKLDDGSANPLYYLDENMLTTFMVYECVPKGTRCVGPRGNRHFIYYTPQAKIELLSAMLDAGYDPRRLPSLNDKTISIGAFQLRRSTFYGLEKLYPKLFDGKTYDVLVKTLSGQSLMTASLLYDNLVYFNRNIYSGSGTGHVQLRRLFTSASIHDKRRFLVSVTAAMYNSGPTDVRNVLNNTTLKRRYKNIEELRKAFIKDLCSAGGKISAPYAEYVGQLYSYVEEKNHYYAYSVLPTPEISRQKNKKKKLNDKKKIGVEEDEDLLELLTIIPFYPLSPVTAEAESDALSIDTSEIDDIAMESQEPIDDKRLKKESRKGIEKLSEIKYQPILGKPGWLLVRETKGMKYYTFTLPIDWKEDDISILLRESSYMEKIKEYNEQDRIERGHYFFLPVADMDSKIRDGSFATVHVDAKIDEDKLIDIAEEYCSGNKKKNAMLIRIYSNIVDINDVDQRWVRIPTGILKDKYKKKYISK
ncbi:hypothetical protein J7J26_01145 [Candidatus Micrarchaeota archaeon]|nr:hypothetical protein [Candidatus Micrarchaeota archaeon]